jgi:hypothetical protein
VVQRLGTPACVAAVLAVGVLALGLAHVAGLPAGLAWSDEIAYAASARHIADGHGPLSSFVHPDSILARGLPLRDVHMPGHTYLLATAFRSFGATERVARATGEAAFLLAGVIVFFLGRVVFDRAAGLWASALFSLFPGAASYGASAMSEATLFPLVASWWLVWCVAQRDGRPAAAAGMGLLLAATATHHETALALLLPAAVALWRWPQPGRGRAVVAFAAGFVPWMALVFAPLYRARAPYPHVLSFMGDAVREAGSLRPVLDTLSRNLQPWSHLGVGFAVYVLIAACVTAAVAVTWRSPGLARRLAVANAIVCASTFVVLAPLHVMRGWIPVRMFVVLLAPSLVALAGGLGGRATPVQRHAVPAIALVAFVALSFPGNAWLALDRREQDAQGRAYSAFVRAETANDPPRIVVAERAYRYGWDAYPVTVIDVDVDGLRFAALAKRVTVDAVVTERAAPFFLDVLRRHGLARTSDEAFERRRAHTR